MWYCFSDGLVRLGKVKCIGLVNVIIMFVGREINVFGNGRFLRVECCYVVG